jgi:heptosyltransferase-2
MDHGPLAGFFVPDLILEPELMDYFGSFHLVYSTIYDPDGIFRRNLRRCGLKEVEASPDLASPAWEGDPPLLLSRDPRVKALPAIFHFARPLRALGLGETLERSHLELSEDDRRFAREKTDGIAEKIVAMHPGSGSVSKNWPAERWIELAEQIGKIKGVRLLVTGGEADDAVLGRMRKSFSGSLWIEDALDLNQLAALYSAAHLFLGHDSGPGHVAAAVGTPCVLLFGSTDPEIWAPRGEQVSILQAKSGWESLKTETVLEAVAQKLRSGGRFL